ncbi:MAG: phosphoserine transaminase [Candidatus Dormibacteria bacterium]
MTTGSGAALVIPHDLLPEDGRFGCGPSKVPALALERLEGAGGRLMGTSHRQPPVRQLVQRVREGLGQLFDIPDGYEVVLGNGGATCFWDVAVYSLIERRSQHLVFGEFSSKFAKEAKGAPHLDAPEVIETPPGTHPEPRENPEVDCYCMTHNETSTGVAMPIERLGSSEQLVLVDATSAAGGVEVDIRATDAYYFSPQKCFASEGGLWLAVLSPLAQERARRLGSSSRWVPGFLDLVAAIDNSKLNQTVNTPAVATLFLLAEQVEWMLDHGGMSWAAARSRQSAEIVYTWAQQSWFASPFVARPEDRSPVVATIDLDPRVSAEEVSRVLRANGIVDTDSYRKLGRNQLRLGLFPAVDPEDVRHLTEAISWVVERLHHEDSD